MSLTKQQRLVLDALAFTEDNLAGWVQRRTLANLVATSPEGVATTAASLRRKRLIESTRNLGGMVGVGICYRLTREGKLEADARRYQRPEPSPVDGATP